MFVCELRPASGHVTVIYGSKVFLRGRKAHGVRPVADNAVYIRKSGRLIDQGHSFVVALIHEGAVYVNLFCHGC